VKTAALVTGTFLLFAKGCGAPTVDDAAITADLACETARMAVRLQGEIAPTPPKPPAPAGKCTNCAGTGVIGDGNSIRMQCPVCKGSGKACADGRCREAR
jgi:hypothetical protein